jgi:hypothetical protein
MDVAMSGPRKADIRRVAEFRHAFPPFPEILSIEPRYVIPNRPIRNHWAEVALSFVAIDAAEARHLMDSRAPRRFISRAKLKQGHGGIGGFWPEFVNQTPRFGDWSVRDLV